MVQLSTSWQMLNSKTVSISGFTGEFQLWGRYSTQDVANNRTKVHYSWDLNITYGWVSSYDAEDYLTGAGWNGATYRTYSSSGTLRSWEEWNNHASDGTGSGSFTGRTRMGGVGVDTDWVSASYTLPTIPRASVPTASPNPRKIWQGGAPLTVYTNRKSSSFTHTVTISCGSWSATQTGVGASTEFNIPYIVGAQFADNTNYATLTVSCTTYNGSTNIGTKTCSVTLQINNEQDHANIGTVTIEDTNVRTSAVTQDDSIYIANISTLHATIPLTVSGSYTQLASATVTCGNKTQNYTLSGTSQTVTFEFDKVNASSLSISVMDKRGNVVRATQTWTLIQYQPITLTATVGRPSATGSAGIGQITGMAYGGEFGATQNSLNISIDFKKHDDPDYDPQGTETATLALSQSGYNSYSDAFTFNYTLDYQYQYDIKFTVSDLFSTATYVAQLMQGLPILSWNETEVDVWGNLHIHDRDNPTQWQDIMQGFNGVLAHNGQKNFYAPFETRTNTGVTFTLQDDGSYKVTGSSTASSTWGGYESTYLPAGDYIMSGSNNHVSVMLRDNNGSYVGESIDGADFNFTVTSGAIYRCYLVVRSGYTCDDTIYPMIRDARIASDDYVPYPIRRAYVNITGKSARATLFKYGRVVYFTSPQDGTYSSGTTTIGTIPVGYRPPVELRVPIGNDARNSRFVIFQASGAILHYANNASSSNANYGFTACWITFE